MQAAMVDGGMQPESSWSPFVNMFSGHSYSQLQRCEVARRPGRSHESDEARVGEAGGNLPSQLIVAGVKVPQRWEHAGYVRYYAPAACDPVAWPACCPEVGLQRVDMRADAQRLHVH